jgi:hypothetical protein
LRVPEIDARLSNVRHRRQGFIWQVCWFAKEGRDCKYGICRREYTREANPWDNQGLCLPCQNLSALGQISRSGRELEGILGRRSEDVPHDRTAFVLLVGH